MDETDAHAVADLKKQVAGLAQAVKAGFFALLLVASYLNIRTILLIPRFAVIYDEMLGGKMLPKETMFVISGRQWLMALACALPAVGITALFAKSAKRSSLVVCALLVLTIAQYYFTSSAISAPLMKIIEMMSGGGVAQ